MAGRHATRERWWRRKAVPTTGRRRRTVEVVDAKTLVAHRLTLEAFDAGRLPQGRYVARCGAEVLPAALVEPGQGSCRACGRVPGQRR